MNRDYPDLVLAAVLGAALAGNARQLTAAALVAVLAAANGLLFVFADILPATVPLGIAATAVLVLERWRGTARRPARKGQRMRTLPGPARQPGAAQPMEA